MSDDETPSSPIEDTVNSIQSGTPAGVLSGRVTVTGIVVRLPGVSST